MGSRADVTRCGDSWPDWRGLAPSYYKVCMRYSRAFLPTLKEVPAEAQVASHVFLIRGGYMRKLAAGVYSFLPLGWRVVKKVEDIVRQEMDRAGAQEVLMPASIPAELWHESERWEKYGPELLRFKDRKGSEFCFGPTHEEVIVDMLRRDVKSYRELPLNLYQIQGKFRDELRPRAGLLRGREFIMKDAYSFHTEGDDVMRTYQDMRVAYRRIFTRAGLEFREVEADTGAIGGSMSHEFQVLAQSGEDKIVSCPSCGYTANVEQAEVARSSAAPGEAGASDKQKVHTPGKGTIADVAAFLGKPPAAFIKTLVYVADDKPVLALVRGDHDLNEVKLKRALGAGTLHLATESVVREVTGAPVGFAGPLELKVTTVGDLDVQHMKAAVTGANENDQHVTGVDVSRDLTDVRWVDLRMAAAGDPCPRCETGRFETFQGIEVGHVFVLGTRYAAPMKCTYLGEDGKEHDMVMGCYGIGVTRVAASAVEQHHDDGGIIWPMSIAPYQVHLMSLGTRDDEVVAEANRLYGALTDLGVEVLYDDRDERPGAKFKDADLVGIPLRVAVGKKSLADGKVELKHRKDAKAELIEASGAAELVKSRVDAELAAIAARLEA